jgi:hypothetical protein
VALLAVDALRAGSQQHADGWALVEPPTLAVAPAPPPARPEALPLPKTRAWLDAVQASGGPPPLPPTGMPAADFAVPPPPPPKAALAPAPTAAPAMASGAVAQAVEETTPRHDTPAAVGAQRGGLASARDWEQRLAFATTSGAAVAAALAAGVVPPPPPKWTLPLRNRVWAAVGGLPAHVGIYSTWTDGGERAATSCAVWGFPSLAEAKAFAQGAGVELPDRRY